MRLLTALTRAGENLARFLQAHVVWTNVYGLARTLLALGTLLTLMFNSSHVLFREGAGFEDRISCRGVAAYTFFCWFPEEGLEVGRWLAIVILCVIASGWRPRLTALPHWFLSLSLHATGRVIDGGDQVTAVLTLLLLPIALTDPRRWHWEAPPTTAPLCHNLLAWSALLAIRVQVAVIYVHAAAAKFAVPEWADGSAMYYWLSSRYMGLPDYLHAIFAPLLTSSFVAVITWGVIILELMLAAALVMSPGLQRIMFGMGVLFHVAIAVFMGITSFAIAMLAALVLYLRSPGTPFFKPVVSNPAAPVPSALPPRRQEMTS